MIFKFALLAALVRLLLVNVSPLMCASIYTVAGVIFAFFSGTALEALLLGGGISFVLAFIYFWLLHRYQETTFCFWFIFIVGAFIGLV